MNAPKRQNVRLSMDYEILNTELQPQEKALKDGLASLQKLFKTVNRERENGDIKSLTRDMEAMAKAVTAVSEALQGMQDTVAGFDTKDYFESGDFAEQMLAACRERGVDAIGEFPVYEMFPYRIRLDAENQDVYMDRKKVQCMRPGYFVDLVKAGQEKLNRANFNAQAFAGELAEAYDLAVLKLNKHQGADLYLNSLYKILAPMGRFRRDYDQQSFAFDIARLINSGETMTKNGRSFQFGPSRNNGKAIRILDREGKEEFFATIRFYQE